MSAHERTELLVATFCVWGVGHGWRANPLIVNFHLLLSRIAEMRGIL